MSNISLMKSLISYLAGVLLMGDQNARKAKVWRQPSQDYSISSAVLEPNGARGRYFPFRLSSPYSGLVLGLIYSSNITCKSTSEAGFGSMVPACLYTLFK